MASGVAAILELNTLTSQEDKVRPNTLAWHPNGSTPTILTAGYIFGVGNTS